MKIFLDDIRNPQDCVKYMGERIGALTYLYMGNWLVVRNHNQFMDAITIYIDEITHVSFDHDLSDIQYGETSFENGIVNISYKEISAEKTGYDCAKWMKEFYRSKDKQLPIMFVHSMNPVGTQNIINLFK